MNKNQIKSALKESAKLNGLTLSEVKAAASGVSEWVAGLPVDTYRPSFDADGELETFNNKVGDKVAGFFVVGEASGKKKMYKKFVGNCEGKDGFEVLTIKGADYLFPINATFGIKASEDTSRPKETYNGIDRHPVKHEYVSE